MVKKNPVCVDAVPVRRDAGWLVDQADLLRLAINGTIDPSTRTKYAQFMTPPAVSTLMASMFRTRRSEIRLLDAGAAVGSLTAAFVAAMLDRPSPPTSIQVTAFEIDELLAKYLRMALSLCKQACDSAGIHFGSEIRREDFIAASAGECPGDLFGSESAGYDCVIMNPPYQKIRSGSETRHCLRLLGIETSNLYTAFMALAARQLKPGGELVSISPRSFCNGPYFRPFRREFLDIMAIQRVHVFESRTEAFREDDVLQENIILYATKSREKPEFLVLSAAAGAEEKGTTRRVRYHEVVNPRDPNLFIHLATDDRGELAADRMSRLPASLDDLGIAVSTGRVVDFRAKGHLRKEPVVGAVPLIYPAHFVNGAVVWPNLATRKPNAIVVDRCTDDLLVPPGVYVLVKRFSAKEERRRIVAAVYDSSHVSGGRVGFENHLNYFHCGGRGLPKALAKGLCLFLNSTLVDIYFRRFSGHTQVNAVDLRSLRYPCKEHLLALSEKGLEDCGDQVLVDAAVEEVLR